MSDVFISYSRKDSEFVQRLNTAFVNANRVVWLDWQDIPRGEDWWREIQSGVENADAFICLISENWLTSEICHNELHYARQNNKRILPLIRQQMRDDLEKRVKGTWMDLPWEQTARDNWEYIRHLNWVFFDQDEKFEAEFASLLKTLEEDQPHIKAHTRYQNRALEWARSGSNPSFLLAGDDLAFAEKWLEGSAGKQPQPTSEHQAYISASREAENTRNAEQAARERRIVQFRRAAIGLAILTALAVVIIGFAVPTSINALNSNATSIAQVQTATHEQGQAIFAQQTSAAREHDSSTQVAIAGATLSPVPPTLTAIASAISDAQLRQAIAIQIANASVQSAQGDNQTALQIVDGLVQSYPDQPLAYLGRGIIRTDAKQYDEAITDFTRAIQLDSGYFSAYLSRGVAYDDQGNLDLAIADYTQAIQINPQSVDAYDNRGQVYNKQGRFQEAIADFNRAIQLNSDYADSYSNRGMAYEKQGKQELAIADYTQAIQLNPQLVEAYYNRGNVYAKQGLLTEAISDYDQAIYLNPQLAEVYNNRGIVYGQQSKFDEFIADFTQAIKLNSQLTEAYMDRGITYYFQGKFSEALADWDAFERLGGILPQQLKERRADLQATLTAIPSLSPTPP